MVELGGVIPILPTIFDAAGAIDEDGTLAVVDYIIDAGGRGIVFPGLASEYDQLDRAERLHMIGRIGERIGGRVPLVVGASAENPDDAIAFAAAGASAGCAAAMILTPRSFATDMVAMAGFFRDAAIGSGLPIMVQNAPPPMGLGLPLEQVAELARAVGAIIYVKEEAAPSGQRITRLTDLAGDALQAVFGGAGARYVIDELKRGAHGTMPACEITELHVAMLDRFADGDETGARDIFERTLPLLSMQAVFRWRLTKRVLLKRGIIDNDYVRAPGPALDRYDRAELDTLLARLSDLLPLERA
jgi:dihydrodipicolinate synthase/N-acetylneuraminate lyase